MSMLEIFIEQITQCVRRLNVDCLQEVQDACRPLLMDGVGFSCAAAFFP